MTQGTDGGLFVPTLLLSAYINSPRIRHRWVAESTFLDVVPDGHDLVFADHCAVCSYQRGFTNICDMKQTASASSNVISTFRPPSAYFFPALHGWITVQITRMHVHVNDNTWVILLHSIVLDYSPRRLPPGRQANRN